VFQDHLKRLKPGRTLALFCDAPSELLAEIELTDPPESEGRSIAVCRVARLDRLDGLLSAMVGSLAEVALALFPFWYGGGVDLRPAHPLAATEAAGAITPARAGVSAAWLRAAAVRCRNGRPPLPRRFAREIQAAQLCLAVGGDALGFVLSMEDPTPREERLLGLARAAEWFARITGARLLVILPTPLSGCKALESLLYGAVFPSPERPARPGAGLADEAKHAYQPIRGHPHPFSPGEGMLARRLAGDDRLNGLFTFNQPVTTVRDRRFVVDLLWPEGRVVVEVDGFASHRSRFAFREDRNRDYELIISGYLVLRLTHEEIMEDPELAVDKIRDLVHFRQSALTSTPATS